MDDSPIRIEAHFQPHTEVLTFRTTQPTEDLIYERNADIRKHNALGDLSFGRQVASIPIIAWQAAIKSGFALDHPDGEIAGREIQRFLATEMGKRCLVREARTKYFEGV